MAKALTRTSSDGIRPKRPGDGASPGARTAHEITSELRKNGLRAPVEPGPERSGRVERRVNEGGTAALSERERRPSSPKCSTRKETPGDRIRPAAAPRRPARARARGDRRLARVQGLPAQHRRHRVRAVLDVLRGPPDRQRHAGHPPRRGPRLQGRLPALPDDEGLPRAPPGRLGLPRPAGRTRRREGAGLHRQARHRGLRHRRVQREVPRERPAPRRRLRGHERAHGLLGRLRARLLDDDPRLRRIGLVGAQADLRQGPAGRGLPGCAVLPALWHRAVRPRGRAGLRGRHRPFGLRPLPADLRPLGRQGRPAGLDDDAVDARVQHRGRRPPGRHLPRRAGPTRARS